MLSLLVWGDLQLGPHSFTDLLSGFFTWGAEETPSGGKSQHCS